MMRVQLNSLFSTHATKEEDAFLSGRSFAKVFSDRNNKTVLFTAHVDVRKYGKRVLFSQKFLTRGPQTMRRTTQRGDQIGIYVIEYETHYLCHM